MLIKLLIIGPDPYPFFNILKIFCFKKNIFFFQFKNIFFYNNFFLFNIYYFIKIKKIKYNAGFVLDYGFIFSLFIIRNFLYGFINIHFSIAPFLKGCKPVDHFLINKNILTGFSFIFINKFFDFGNIIYLFKTYFSLFNLKNILLNLKINYLILLNIFFAFKIFKKKIYYNHSQFNVFCHYIILKNFRLSSSVVEQRTENP